MKACPHILTRMTRHAASGILGCMAVLRFTPPPSIITGLQPSNYIVFTSYSTGLLHIPQRDARQAGAAYMLPLP